MDLIVLSLAPVFIIAGYIYFRDKYEKEPIRLLLKALLFGALTLHGIYNFILFTGIEWLTIVFIAFLVFLYISGLKRIRELSDQSIYKTDYDLLNEKFGQNNQG